MLMVSVNALSTESGSEIGRAMGDNNEKPLTRVFHAEDRVHLTPALQNMQ